MRSEATNKKRKAIDLDRSDSEQNDESGTKRRKHDEFARLEKVRRNWVATTGRVQNAYDAEAAEFRRKFPNVVGVEWELQVNAVTQTVAISDGKDGSLNDIADLPRFGRKADICYVRVIPPFEIAFRFAYIETIFRHSGWDHPKPIRDLILSYVPQYIEFFAIWTDTQCWLDCACEDVQQPLVFDHLKSKFERLVQTWQTKLKEPTRIVTMHYQFTNYGSSHLLALSER